MRIHNYVYIFIHIYSHQLSLHRRKHRPAHYCKQRSCTAYLSDTTAAADKHIYIYIYILYIYQCKCINSLSRTCKGMYLCMNPSHFGMYLAAPGNGSMIYLRIYICTHAHHKTLSRNGKTLSMQGHFTLHELKLLQNVFVSTF